MKNLNMKFRFTLFLLFFYCLSANSQNGFHFDNNKKKITIPFKLINNLVFLPITVNGVELNFLLDTGSSETVLFSLEDQGEVSFNEVQKIKLKGFGYDEYIDGLKSSKNKLSTHGFTDLNHLLYIVLDQNFNLSAQVGIPVNGIIGYNFFRNYLVEIDYQRSKIFIHQENSKIRKKLENNYSSFAINLESNKPYFNSKITIDNKEIETKMLLDTGSSDALWLFQNRNNNIKIPNDHFEDYLGRGFSGDIFGKRARIEKLSLNKFQLQNPITSFPDTLAINKSLIVQDREGSIGGEVFKRFDMVLDYPNNKMYLKKNVNFDLPFNYNMSGIEIQHGGLQFVKETQELNKPVFGSIKFDLADERIVNFNYKFELKPIFKISSIRKNSPAEECGLKKDDTVISINGQLIYRYSLQEINELLKSEEGKWIFIQIERNKIKQKLKFQLRKLL